MANREALRDLQSRLAGRLQAARSEGGQSGEIFPWAGVQPVPYTKPWFLGIANLRGTLAGVIDLASLLGHGVARSEPALAESSLLAFNAALEVNAALLVDRLQGLRSADAFVRTEAAPEHSPAFFGPVHIDEAGHRWQELQLQRLSQTSEFLSIRA
jgi:twitching motility protein PilI